MESIENNPLFRTVFDSAANGIAIMQSVYDDNGRIEDFEILLFNKFTLNWIGDVEYKGKRYGDVFPMVKETGILQKFIAVAETGVADNFESWYEGEGMKHWFRFTAVKQDELLVITTEDISEIKQAAVDLKESESHFKALVNASSDVIYSLNADWSIMRPLDGRGFLSDAHAPVEGWMEINVHAADRDAVKKAIAEAIANKSTFEMEHRVNTVDGGTGWTFSRAIPILDEQQNIIEWFGAASDITERKTIEQSLKQSESRFRNVINTTPVGTGVLIGPELMIETANDVILKFWNRDHSIIGKPFTEAIPEYSTGVAHTDHEALAYFHNAEGQLVSGYFNYSYTPLRDPDGTIYGVLIMATDVAKEMMSRKILEESESRYRALSQTLEHQVNERTRELQRSNEDLQQFAHVASHDLKEPVRKIKTFTNRLET
ncbi:MAG: PAS domain-containing protein, partial [Bacteroidota bacterium]